MEKFVAESYEKYPNNHLYLCGHSLGGALAQACLLYYLFGPADKRRKVHKIYTIGQPIVCNAEGRRTLEGFHSDVEYFVCFLFFKSHLSLLSSLPSQIKYIVLSLIPIKSHPLLIKLHPPLLSPLPSLLNHSLSSPLPSSPLY